ncbi:MAG TPA: DUF4352 domain-containing protein [Ktedonobacteraceae bacterium]
MNQYPNDPTTGYNQPYPNTGQMPPPPGYPQPGYPQPGYPPPGQYTPPPPGYPQQPMPMQQPPKKSKKGLWITLGIIIGAVVLCAAIASGSHNTGTKVSDTSSSTTKSTNDTTTSSQPPPQQHFKVGDTVKVGTDWQVVVNGIKTSSGGEFDTLKPGKRFIEVDVSMTNTSTQEQTTSGIVDWTLLDSTGQKADWDTVSDGSAPEPDGKIEPGQTLRGTLAYQAVATQNSFTLEFDPSMFGSGQTLWDLTVQ